MYEGWHIELTHHARRRMRERLVDMADVRRVVTDPDELTVDDVHGGRLLSKYLPDWHRILVVAIEERSDESVVMVKTILWSEAN